MVKIIKLTTITLVPLLLVSAIFLNILYAPKSYASIGAEFRASILNKEKPQEEVKYEFDQAAFEKAQAEAEKKDYWFTAPNGFLKNPLSKEEAKKRFQPEITPETNRKAWMAMSVPERVASCNTSEDILKSVQTDELIMYCMNYPMMGDMTAFNSLKEGFERMVLRYDGLKELQNRKDSGKELLKLYKLIDLNHLVENDRWAWFRFMYLEMMIAHDNVLETLTKEESRELVVECFNKAKKISEDDALRIFSTATTVYLGMKCLYMHDENFAKIVNSSKGIKNFVETSTLNLDNVDDNTLGKVVAYFQNKYL